MEFRLGDRVEWVPRKRTAIIISLLEYYGEYGGEQRGMIGIVTEDTKEGFTVSASECVDYKSASHGPPRNENQLEDWEPWEPPELGGSDY